MDKKLKSFLRSSGLNSSFTLQDCTYSDYISIMSDIIVKTNQHITEENQAQIIQDNAPFIWKPNVVNPGSEKNGIILTHGLFESPYSLQDIGKYFLSQHFWVQGLLLPGHGTNPGDLLSTHYQDWIKALAFAVDNLAKEVDNIYLLGFSTGACLSLYHALSKGKIKGLILFAPSIGFRSKLIGLSPFIQHIKPWYVTGEEIHHTRYRSHCFNAISQTYHLSTLLSQQPLQRLDAVPIFMVMSEDDETIDPQAATHIFNQCQHPHNKLIIYSKHVRPSANPKIAYRSSVYPGNRVLDFSHNCMHLHPDNFHFGMESKFHITATDIEEAHINDTSHMMKGALSQHNIKNHPVTRLTYNPDYTNLLHILERFLVKIGAVNY